MLCDARYAFICCATYSFSNWYERAGSTEIVLPNTPLQIDAYRIVSNVHECFFVSGIDVFSSAYDICLYSFNGLFISSVLRKRSAYTALSINQDSILLGVLLGVRYMFIARIKP